MARILIVEDEPSPLRLMTRVLADHGHETRGALSGEEAMVMAGAFQPELLVSDWLLQDRTGYEVALAVRLQSPGVKTLFITGFPADTIREQARQVSPWPVLEKPIDIDTLAARVEEVLTKPAPLESPWL